MRKSAKKVASCSRFESLKEIKRINEKSLVKVALTSTQSKVVEGLKDDPKVDAHNVARKRLYFHDYQREHILWKATACVKVQKLNNVVANHVCQCMDNTILCENPIGLRKVQGDKVAYARTLSIFMSDHLTRTNSSFKQIIFEKFFNHTLTKEIMLNYVQDVQKERMNQKLVDNLRSNLSSHLVGQKS